MEGNLHRTVTVKQLKQLLDQFDDDLPVVLQGDYGDRINTPEVHYIQGAEHAPLRETAYSNTGWAVDFKEEDPEAPWVVVLSYDNSNY